MRTRSLVLAPCCSWLPLLGLIVGCATAGTETISDPDRNATSMVEPGDSQVTDPQVTDPQPTSEPSEPSPGIDNSQTGSVGGSPTPECAVDADCATLPESDLAAMQSARVELLGAQCSHEVINGARPTCACHLRRSWSSADAGAPEAIEYDRYPGNRADHCSEHAFSGVCMYCENEFPGCDTGDAGSCDAVCADVASRDEAEMRHPYALGIRLAHCNADLTCSVVSSIDGQCYLGHFGDYEPPRVDCNLSDEALLALLASPPSGNECAPRPEPSCATSADCPRGLSCAGGVCGPCGAICSTMDAGGVCRGGGACADGEVCVEDTCVLEANVTCSWFGECPDDQLCAVSGVSATGRGNEATRSLCIESPYR